MHALPVVGNLTRLHLRCPSPVVAFVTGTSRMRLFAFDPLSRQDFPSVCRRHSRRRGWCGCRSWAACTLRRGTSHGR